MGTQRAQPAPNECILLVLLVMWLRFKGYPVKLLRFRDVCGLVWGVGFSGVLLEVVHLCFRWVMGALFWFVRGIFRNYEGVRLAG